MIQSSANSGVSHRRTILFTAYSISFSSGFWIYNILTKNTLPTFDLGQWIAYSRYFLGQEVPPYRIGHGIPPFIPFILAASTSIIGESIKSSVIISSILFAALSISSFFAARYLFEDDMCAVIATILTSFGQIHFAYMISFGGLPQLTALIGINSSIIALTRIMRNDSNNMAWLLLSGSCLITCFSHMPTAPIYFLSVFICMILISIISKSKSFAVISRCVKYLFVPTVAWICYLVYYFEQQIEYTKNTSGYHLRGIDTISWYFNHTNWILYMTFMSLASLAFVIVRSTIVRNYHVQENIIIILVWLFIPIIFMFISYLVRVGTDYPRFIYYFIQIPLFSIAYTVSFLIKRTKRLFNNRHANALSIKKLTLTSATLLSCLIIIIGNIYYTLEFIPQAVAYFSTRHSSSLLSLIYWLNENKIHKTILAPSRVDANWIEGLSGQSTLFPNQFRWLYRPKEVDRALAADVMSTGASLAMENGFMYLLFGPSSNGFMMNPSIATYYKGEYFELITLQDDLITITIDRNGVTKHLNLAKDFDQTYEYFSKSNISESIIISQYTHEGSNEILVTKTITMPQDDAKVLVEYVVSAIGNTKIDTVDFQMRGLPNIASERTINVATKTWITFLPDGLITNHSGLDGDYTGSRLNFLPRPSNLVMGTAKQNVDEPYLRATYDIAGQRMANILLTITALGHDRFRNGLKLYSRPELLKNYNVGYLIVSQTDVYVPYVYEELGYIRMYNNSNYIVYRVP